MLEGLTIEWILIILICIIMLSSILLGLLHGFKKSMYKLIATIIFWVIFWISAPFVKGKFILESEAVFNSLSPILASTGIDVSVHSNLLSFLKELIANMASLDLSTLNDPAVDNTIIAIIHSFVKIIYLIELSIVYAIIRPIVYVIFFKKNNKVSKKSIEALKQKQIDYIAKNGSENEKLAKRIYNNEITLKRNKIYKPLGMASGFARGLLSSFLILCVINSTIKLVPDLSTNNDITASTEENDNTKQSLYDFILAYTNNNPAVKTAIDMIAEYQNSTLIKTTGIKIGKTYADDLFTDAIVSGKSKDYSFGIRKELSIIIQVASKAYNLTNGFAIETVDFANLSESQVKNLQDILLLLSDDDLINNLGTVMVGIAISLDAVSEFMPSNIDDYNLDTINWNNELKTIATLVGNVYSLGNLNELDYLNLDPEKVAKVVTNLSELQSVNFLGYVGGSYAIKTLIQNDENYASNLKNIEKTLATLAVEGKLSADIATFDDLYGNFINLFSQINLDDFKDSESGKITNYLKLLTSVDAKGYESIINTIFETQFVEEILPNVLTIIKEKLIPVEYSSLINPKITTSKEWEGEVNSLLTMVSELTDGGNKPFEKIETFDFKVLSGFSTNTIVNSELLSYAMIKILIDTSKNEGVISTAAGDLTNYICIPDYLTKEADNDHKFDKNWYDTKDANGNVVEGELSIMLDTIKNCLAKIDDISNPLEAVPDILVEIGKQNITESDVLYCSLDKIIKQYTDYLIIPMEDIVVNPDKKYTVNDKSIENLIKKDSLTKLLNVFTGSNETKLKALPLEELFVYFKVDENGNASDTPISKDDLDLDDKYVVKLDVSVNKLFNVLTSYYKINTDSESNTINSNFLESSILRATISKHLIDNAGEYIEIPDASINSSTILNHENELKVITQREFIALIGGLTELELNIESILDNPINAIDAMKKEVKDENGTTTIELKECVPGLFKESKSSTYSGILHATLSKYIIDLAEQNSSDSFSIVIPNCAKDEYDNALISGEETVNLIRSVAIIGTDIFDSSKSQNELINSVVNNVVDNNDALNSLIIRATLTKYLNDTYKIDVEATYEADYYDSDDQNPTKIYYQEDMVDLLNVLDTLNTDKDFDASKAFLDINDITIGSLKTLVDDEKTESILFRAIIKDLLKDKKFTISAAAEEKISNDKNSDLSSNIITTSEINALITSLDSLLGSDKALSKISNSDISGLSLETIDNCKDNIAKSIIIRIELTKQLESNTNIEIPKGAYETNQNFLSKEETKNLISSLYKLVGNKKINEDISLNEVTIEDIKKVIESNESLIIHATIHNEIVKQNNITIPKNDVLGTDGYITNKEMSNMFTTLCDLLGNDIKISGISLDSVQLITMKNALDGNNSKIINATITSKLKDSLTIPKDVLDNDKVYINEDELKDLFSTLCDLLGETTSIDSISSSSLNNLTINKINGSIKNNNSKIINATIVNKLKKQSDVVITSYINEEKTLIDNTELINLFNIVSSLVGEKKINNIDISNVKISEYYNVLKDNEEKEKQSNIFNATVSNKIKGVGVLKIPNDGEIIENDIIKYSEIVNLLKVMNAILGDKSLNNVESITIDNIIDLDTKNDGDLFASYIFRATITENIKAYLSIEGQDNNILKYGDLNKNDILVVDFEEFNKLHSALKAIKGDSTASLDSLIEGLTINDWSKKKDALLSSESEVIRKKISSIVKKQFVKTSSTLKFLNKLYTNINDKVYIDWDELEYLFDTFNIINGHKSDDEKVDGFDSLIFSIDNNSFIFELTDDEINAIFKSTLISYNIREQIVIANTSEENNYFGGVLVLETSIDADDVVSKEYLNKVDKHTYTTVNDDTTTSDICELIKTIVWLKNNSYLEIITSGKETKIEDYREKEFILKVTNDNILRDSLPNIIENISGRNDNSMFKEKGIEIGNIPVFNSSEYEDPINASIEYWQGINDYSDSYWKTGELYCFIDFIVALNEIEGVTTVEETKQCINRMTTSKLAAPTVDSFLTNEYALDLIKLRGTTLDPDDAKDENGCYNWNSTNGQKYIETFAENYIIIKEQLYKMYKKN